MFDVLTRGLTTDNYTDESIKSKVGDKRKVLEEMLNVSNDMIKFHNLLPQIPTISGF